ncbi:MAG: helix-turn-helix transcriptional regulator [Pseudonocardiales bacterium]|nr:helix-turn-helix transcriptional regulator [Pseudonocardiales bacterium]
MTTTTRSTAGGAGVLLRSWREQRRLSQLDLAHLAGTSTRHLSYLETGRSRPSREMVLRLGETMDVPLSERNRMLLAAGHAPAYADARQDRAATRYLLEVLDLALAAYDPWPALVLDAQFDVVATNHAVDRMMLLVDADLLDPPVNVVRVMLHPRGLSQYVTNLAAWRGHLLRQVRQHAAAAPSADLDALLREAEGYPVPPSQEMVGTGPTFALPLELDIQGQQLRMYSTIATFGTPLDVAASELAIETFLPADEATRQWLAAACIRGSGS